MCSSNPGNVSVYGTLPSSDDGTDVTSGPTDIVKISRKGSQKPSFKPPLPGTSAAPTLPGFHVVTLTSLCKEVTSSSSRSLKLGQPPTPMARTFKIAVGGESHGQNLVGYEGEKRSDPPLIRVLRPTHTGQTKPLNPTPSFMPPPPSRTSGSEKQEDPTKQRPDLTPHIPISGSQLPSNATTTLVASNPPQSHVESICRQVGTGLAAYAAVPNTTMTKEESDYYNAIANVVRAYDIECAFKAKMDDADDQYQKFGYFKIWQAQKLNVARLEGIVAKMELAFGGA
ncbi:hypothetical protein TWF281_002753 [Arthrobotrys megalospora]